MEQEAKTAFNELMEVAETLKNVIDISSLTDVMQDLYSKHILPAELNNERN